jgi:hypothetical protein
MPLDLTPLETLTPAVEKVAGAKAPPPIRMMAARGLAPLKPAEQLTALYQLATAVSDGEDGAKSAAMKTATALPEKVLAAALGEPLDARVLDFFSRRVWQKPKLLEVVLLNKSTSDVTFQHLATLCAEGELEMIAKNEERLLRHPPIIAALYMNPRTRMSTAQRAVELAVRNGVKVDGIPAFEETQKVIAESQTRTREEEEREDAAFKRAAEVVVDASAQLIVATPDDPEQAAREAEEAARAEALAQGELPPDVSKEEVEDKKQRLEDLSPAGQIRAATLGNSFARSVLIRSKNKQVAMACIRSPAVSDAEVLNYATNRSLDDDIIRFISHKRQWIRHYGIKVALCNNPKCPMPIAMGFLSHLRPPELKALARSKGIPSALANAAKQLLRVRSGDGGNQ